MKSIKAALAVSVSAAFVFFSYPLWAQAPVEDRSMRSSNSSPPGGASPRPDPNAQLIVEMQNLRQELSYLRGTVEELQYQVDQLAEQQDQNYSDLDNRVQGLYSGAVNAPAMGSGGTSASRPSSSAGVTPVATETNSQAASLYQQGFDALRAGERDKAINAFNQVVQQHPQSAEVPDSLYWLGETYWLANRREDSREAFVQLLQQSPNYRKADDAKYRLGVIYEQLGDLAKAREYMQQAAQGTSGQAVAAKSWLDQHSTAGSSQTTSP